MTDRAPWLSPLLDAVSERLQWNVAAYGKAWTGEDEDTAFIVEPLTEKLDEIREALEAAQEIFEWGGGYGSRGYDAQREVAARKKFAALQAGAA